MGIKTRVLLRVLFIGTSLIAGAYAVLSFYSQSQDGEAQRGNLARGSIGAQGQGSHSLGPSYSPDGTQVVFYSDVSNSLDLWITTSGGQLQNLTQDPDPSSEVDPAWSPDGSRIVFSTTKAGNHDIWVVNANGSNPVRLTTDSADEDQPAWSPDGSKIAFIRSGRDGLDDIRVMSADGSNNNRLPNVPGRPRDPSFSPDGTKLVFSAAVETAFNLMIMNIDGTNSRRLTTELDVRDSEPVWGSGGIVFVSNRGGSYNLWRIQPDGSGLEMIPNTTSGSNPAWAPDGFTVAFSREDPSGATSNIYTVNLNNAVVEPLTNIRGYFEAIDIVPGSEPNTINIGTPGAVSVAILAAQQFDPLTEIDQATLTFGRTGDEASVVACDPTGTDVNGDTLPDFVCHFDVQQTGFQVLDTQGILRARTVNNFLIEGRDSVHILN